MADDPRILIVGAGAAGLSLALALKARGHTRVTVLERSDRVGGKCKTLVHNGKPYDLGANFSTPRYTRTRALAESVGLQTEWLGPRRTVSVVDEPVPEASLLAGWFLEAATRWYLQRRSWTPIDEPGLANLPPALRGSFRDWLSAGGLGPIAKVFDSLFTAYGYGPVGDLPAAYGLKFFDPVHLSSAVKVVRGQTIKTTTDFVGGFQALWSRLVDHHGLDVQLGAEVVGVERSDAGVTVRLVQDGVERTETGDRLVLACPLQHSLGFLDASEQERELFSKIRTFDYRVVAATTRGLDDISTYLYPWSRVWTPGEPTAFYKPTLGDPDEVFLFYAYGSEDHDDETILGNIREAVAREPFTAELVDVLAVQRWTYFPHVSVADMQAGFYDRLEGLQGQRNTFYVGEVLTFPLIELVIEYSEALADRHF